MEEETTYRANGSELSPNMSIAVYSGEAFKEKEAWEDEEDTPDKTRGP